MLSSRWLCSRCLGLSLRTAARSHRQRRFQSTASPDATSPVVSPVLLNRARSIAIEHARLTAENAENYDVAVAKKVGELGRVAAALKEWEDAQNTLQELDTLLHDTSSDAELRALAESDIESTTNALPTLSNTLRTSLIPPHPFAHLPALIEIHPGAGGSEASLFGHTLLNMYTSLCSRLGHPCSLTSYTPDETVSSSTPGLTDAILEVSTPGAYDLLRTEAGVHRVQRVPLTEKKGRTHTSAVSVLVLPSLPETSTDSEMNFDDPTSDYYIAPTDVRSETMRARGAGGQHVNKTDSAVRLTHIPTGIVVGMQDSRSQHKNREKAWTILRAKLAAKRREEREAEMVALRRSVMGGVARTGREDKVRTYNFSQSRVTDHRCGVESTNLEAVLEGGAPLEEIMGAVREWMVEGEVMGVVEVEEMKERQAQREKENGGNGKNGG